MNRFSKYAWFLSLVILMPGVRSFALTEQIELSGNPTMILQPTPGETVSMYFALAYNAGNEPVVDKIRFYVPKETTDIQADPSLEVLDFNTNEGYVEIQKNFLPGKNVLALKLLMKFNSRTEELSFDPKLRLRGLQLLIPAQSSASVIDNNNIKFTEVRKIQQLDYKQYIVESLGDGDQNTGAVVAQLIDLPVGRRPFTILAWIFAALIFGFSFALTAKSMKKIE